ncbi:MAG: hypothetical protein DRQ39_05945 [Gammaproteobacteria bacterium]|nr:MAG: hypothetical protein DRQ39_05945 [Gammaproteobacteria bacterium]
MEITITHCRYAPKWESLQQVIRETTNEPRGQLVRISRDDNGCSYRAPGVYSLEFRQNNNTVLPIRLEIVAVGKKPVSDLDRRIEFVKDDPALAEAVRIGYKNMAEAQREAEAETE